ncbi:hypothetical protein [Halocatena marina]|uniref:Uncharacterized protein n=1 Tax=Halocatena marina TaxID=2934937 RepID=A0ABD5YPI8_9EURY|nr:hypothetical protein [Halocatena marina]
MVTLPENSDEESERSSATSTRSSHYETGRGRSHALIESGCIREFAVHVLGAADETTDTESITDIEITQLTASDAEQTIEAVQQLEKYKQTAALLEKYGGCQPSPAQYTIAAHVNSGRSAWEIVAFEAYYPKIGKTYPIFGRAVNRETSPVAALIDPSPSPVDGTNAATVFEITTERVSSTKIRLDHRISERENTDDYWPSEEIGYQIAIDWFVS